MSAKVRQAGLLDLYGLQGHTNVQGEEQKKLDVLANNSFIESLRRSQKVGTMVSEENEELVVGTPSGRYAAVFDPLDGSSNIDVNISIGTIFGIYRRAAEGAASEADVLRPGSELVAAGYTMYGSATILMISLGRGVQGFTLDCDAGEFVLSWPDVKIKPSHPIYSVNQGNQIFWDQPTNAFVTSLTDGKAHKPFSHRYVGSMVADVHRTFLYGGIFMYPGDKNSKDGKLRLLYEANPMAFLVEQAGGRATTGTTRILDIVPSSIHQRVPVFLGSRELVLRLEAAYAAQQ